MEIKPSLWWVIWLFQPTMYRNRSHRLLHVDPLMNFTAMLSSKEVSKLACLQSVESWSSCCAIGNVDSVMADTVRKGIRLLIHEEMKTSKVESALTYIASVSIFPGLIGSIAEYLILYTSTNVRRAAVSNKMGTTRHSALSVISRFAFGLLLPVPELRWCWSWSLGCPGCPGCPPTWKHSFIMTAAWDQVGCRMRGLCYLSHITPIYE